MMIMVKVATNTIKILLICGSHQSRQIKHFFYLKDLRNDLIFQSGTGLVSLEEFRAMVNRKQEMSGEQREDVKFE